MSQRDQHVAAAVLSVGMSSSRLSSRTSMSADVRPRRLSIRITRKVKQGLVDSHASASFLPARTIFKWFEALVVADLAR
jgi:hypothetical protein